MNFSQNFDLLLVVLYILAITLVKKFYLNKKFDLKKSNFIYDCLNAILIPYFIVINQYIIAAVWAGIFAMKIYVYKRK